MYFNKQKIKKFNRKYYSKHCWIGAILPK